MFYNGSLLESLPNISKWKTNNFTNMSFMFYNGFLLESLPDLSKWKTVKFTNMSIMFYYCSSL